MPFHGLQHMPRRNLVLTSLRRISLGHYALRLIPFAICCTPFAIGHTLFYGLRQVPPRCLVLASLLRSSRGHPALRHVPFAISHLLYAIRHALTDHSSRVTRHCFSLCCLRVTVFSICHMPCAIRYLWASAGAPSMSGPRYAAEDFSGALCSPPYRSLIPNV